MQAEAEPYVQLLPNTGTTISVSFYNTAPQKLALHHPIVASLLQVCPKDRRGYYTVPTADFMNVTRMPAAQVGHFDSPVNTPVNAVLSTLLSRFLPILKSTLLAMLHHWLEHRRLSSGQ